MRVKEIAEDNVFVAHNDGKTSICWPAGACLFENWTHDFGCAFLLVVFAMLENCGLHGIRNSCEHSGFNLKGQIVLQLMREIAPELNQRARHLSPHHSRQKSLKRGPEHRGEYGAVVGVDARPKPSSFYEIGVVRWLEPGVGLSSESVRETLIGNESGVVGGGRYAYFHPILAALRLGIGWCATSWRRSWSRV